MALAVIGAIVHALVARSTKAWRPGELTETGSSTRMLRVVELWGAAPGTTRCRPGSGRRKACRHTGPGRSTLLILPPELRAIGFRLYDRRG